MFTVHFPEVGFLRFPWRFAVIGGNFHNLATLDVFVETPESIFMDHIEMLHSKWLKQEIYQRF